MGKVGCQGNCEVCLHLTIVRLCTTCLLNSAVLNALTKGTDVRPKHSELTLLQPFHMQIFSLVVVLRL